MNTTLSPDQQADLAVKAELLHSLWFDVYRKMGIGMEEFVIRYIAGKLPVIKPYREDET